VTGMTALENSLKIDHETPFDLRTQPGWRVSVFELGPNDYVVSIVMHHIISDGWSVDVPQKEISAFYAAAIHHQDPLPCVEPLAIQYKDYALWQRQEQQIAEQEYQLNYWVSHLRTSQPPEFLCDKPRPTTLSGEAAVERLRIEGPLYDMLKLFCKQHSVTPNLVLLATYRATHYRLTGSTDANIGILNSNRDKWELKNIIGFFVNLQCIRLLVEEDTFEQLVKQSQKSMAAAFENQDVPDVPFENIVAKLKKDRDLSRNPLAQVIFAFNPQQNLGTFDLEGVSSEPIPVPPTTRFDMEFHFYQEQDYLQGEVLFSTDLYDPSTISNMLSIFEKVLSEGLGESTSPISSLPLLTKESSLELERLGLTAIDRLPYPRDQSLVDLSREQARTYPDGTAVKDNTSQLSYRELDHESDILTRWLLTTGGVAPEGLVGIFSGRSCNMVIAQLGILKASLACIPLDTRRPRGRLESMLSSLPSRKLVLTGTRDEFPDIQDVEFVRIEDALGAGRKFGHYERDHRRLTYTNKPGLRPVHLRIDWQTKGSYAGTSWPSATREEQQLPPVLPLSPHHCPPGKCRVRRGRMGDVHGPSERRHADLRRHHGTPRCQHPDRDLSERGYPECHDHPCCSQGLPIRISVHHQATGNSVCHWGESRSI
jgi:hypothetical protein